MLKSLLPLFARSTQKTEAKTTPFRFQYECLPFTGRPISKEMLILKFLLASQQGNTEKLLTPHLKFQNVQWSSRRSTSVLNKWKYSKLLNRSPRGIRIKSSKNTVKMFSTYFPKFASYARVFQKHFYLLWQSSDTSLTKIDSVFFCGIQFGSI